MGLFKKCADQKTAIARMKEADRKLNEYGDRAKKRGIRHETPTYTRLNKAANEAAAEVSWWLGGTKRR